MSITTNYGYKQSFSLTAPIPSDAKSLQADNIDFHVEPYTEEEIRQMHPDWGTKKPVSFEEMFGCLGLTPEESEAFMPCIEEGRTKK